MNKKKFIIDALLNIISSMLPLIILQLISLPIAASKLGAENYGVLITVISILTVISFPIGNVLNNIRLLNNEIYIENKISGDFNHILFGSTILSAFLMTIFSLFFISDLSIYNLFLLIVIVVLSIFKEYLIVSYRINLNFKGILMNNIFLSLGYAIGTYFFYSTNYWEYIYLGGLIFSLLYLLLTTNLLYEPLMRTERFNKTLQDFLILYGSGLLKNFLNYADKIILLPLLGPKNVSIYYAASILGKIVSMLFNPINNVVLSYLAKMNGINHKLFKKAFLTVTIVGVFGYFLTVFISPYFLSFFYTDWASESLNLIFITSATAILSVWSSIFHPFNLRFNKLKWQVYMNGSNLIFYLILAVFLTNMYGLMGFTVAVLISSLYRYIFQLIIYFRNASKN